MKPFRFNGYQIGFGLMALLTAFCLWKAGANFYAGAVQRPLPVKVLGAELNFRWLEGDSEPYYEMALDMQAQDGSERTFSWRVDAGRAVYPEEALDVFADWAPGTVHQISTVRGQSRQLRFNELEDNPEINMGIGWIFLAVFTGLTALALQFLSNEKGAPWMIFFAFGLIPLLGGLAMGVFGVRKLITWEPVVVQKLRGPAEFDFSQQLENVKYDPKAVENMKDRAYELFGYELRGKRFRLGQGAWRGVLGEANLEEADPHSSQRYFVNPANRWDFDRRLSWMDDVLLPTGILGGFGVVFIAIALFIRRSSWR